MKRLLGFGLVAAMLAFGGCSTAQPVATPGYSSSFATPEPPNAVSSERSHNPSQSGQAQTASANGSSGGSSPAASGVGAPPPVVVPTLAPPPPIVTVPPPAVAPPPPPPPIALP